MPAETQGGFVGGFTTPTLSGSSVTPQSALTITAVWNAVNIYANNIACLNLYVAERDPRGGIRPAPEHPSYSVVKKPNRLTTSFRFRQSIIGHALTFGNGYAEIEFSGSYPVALHLLDPRNITPFIDEDGNLWYKLNHGPSLPASKVVHIAGMGWDGIRGYSPITLARESLGLALAQQNYQSALIGNGAVPTGYLEYPGALDEVAKNKLRDGFNKVHQGAERAGNVALLTGGIKWVQTSFSPADAELLTSRNFSIAEVARLFNLPQHMLGQMDSATFGNIEEQNIQFYQSSLMPWLVSIEQELDAKLFSIPDQSRFFVQHDVKSLLRGNLAAQTARETALFNIGVLSINEIRSDEGLNPVEGGDRRFVPTNNMSALDDLMRPPTVPTTDATVPQTTDATEIQDTALNGAQIESLLEIVGDVASGTLPIAAAKGLISAAFPTLSQAKIDAILGPMTGFTPSPSEDKGKLPDGALDALRGALVDPVSRMVRRECQAVRKQAKRADFADWLDEFLPAHVATVAESIGPALRALGTIQGQDHDPRSVAESMAEESREKLRGLVVCVPPDEMPEAVDKVCADWELSRANEIVERLCHV